MGIVEGVRDLQDDALVEAVRQLVGRSNRLTAELLVHLGEVDARRLYLEHACSSMFTWCTGRLGFAESVAYSRIRVARIARRFPAVLAYVAAGRVHLTGISLLAAQLTEANHREVLDAACGKSKREIEELVATLAPRPNVPAGIRKLPDPSPGRARAMPTEITLPKAQTEGQGPRSRRDVVAPLAPERFRVQFTASREQVEKLKRLQELLSHQVSAGDLAGVVERAVDLLTERLEARQNAKVKRPRTQAKDRAAAHSRQVPAAVRRAVAQRDDGQCAFVDKRGMRCQERRRLEYDHIHPVGMGGDHGVSNVRLLCRAHNAHAARRAYGADFVERAVGRSRLAKPRAP